VLVPCNSRYRGDEAAYVLRRSRARLLVVSDTFLGNDYLGMLAAQGELPDLREIVVLADDPVVRDRLAARAWPDHLATGEATLSAVYPDARNPFAHVSLLRDGGL
jgi:hypothetical protein